MSREQLDENENPHFEDSADDRRLLAIAIERMSHYDSCSLISSDEMNNIFGITEDDLIGWEDIEIE